MARQTQQQRRERTRAALIEAAAEVFAREGYSAARVEQIAERARVTTGALYGHFQSKQGLFLAVFDEFAVRRVHDIERATQPTDGVPSPRAGADQWMSQLQETPWRFWLHLEFAHYARNDPALRERFATSVAAVRLAIERLIEGRLAESELKSPVSAGWLATVIRALGMGLSLEHLTDPEAVPAEMFGQAVELITQLLEGVSTERQQYADIDQRSQISRSAD
jgi:AcrR family transcriptional regulator